MKNAKKKYRAGKGNFNKARVQVYGERLDRIATKNKGVTPTLVVDDAKATSSPLHECFEWNNGKAALAHRLEQARQLVRFVEIDLIVIGDRTPKDLGIIDVYEDESPPQTRQFRSVGKGDEKSYQPIEVVQATPEYRKEAIAGIITALRRVQLELRLYQGIARYAGDIEAIIKKIKKAT